MKEKRKKKKKDEKMKKWYTEVVEKMRGEGNELEKQRL